MSAVPFGTDMDGEDAIRGPPPGLEPVDKSYAEFPCGAVHTSAPWMSQTGSCPYGFVPQPDAWNGMPSDAPSLIRTYSVPMGNRRNPMLPDYSSPEYKGWMQKSQSVRKPTSSGFAELLYRMLDGDNPEEAIASLREPGGFAGMAFDPMGCRVAQQALEKVDETIAAELSMQMKGKIAEAIVCPYAHNVVLKMVAVCTLEQMPFLADELKNMCIPLARHEYGCRILAALLDRAPTDPLTTFLIEAALTSVRTLPWDPYGHFVLQRVLEQGIDEHKEVIIEALRADLDQLIWFKYTVHVVEKALLHGSKSQEELANDILAKTDTELVIIAKSPVSCGVVRALFRSSSENVKEDIFERMSSASAQEQLLSTREGRLIVEEFYGDEEEAYTQ